MLVTALFLTWLILAIAAVLIVAAASHNDAFKFPGDEEEQFRAFSDYRQRLFDHFAESHDLILLESEMVEIEHIVLSYFPRRAATVEGHVVQRTLAWAKSLLNRGIKKLARGDSAERQAGAGDDPAGKHLTPAYSLAGITKQPGASNLQHLLKLNPRPSDL